MPPPPDTDNDGIPDALDDCYLVMGVPSDIPGQHGCPLEPEVEIESTFRAPVATGQYLWTLTWGGPGNSWTDDDYLNAIACDSNGNICVSGRFSLQADYDPGPGVDIRDPGRFLSRFDKDGNYNGTVIWDANGKHATGYG